MPTLYIIGGIILYILAGIITSLIAMKISGDSFRDIQKEEAYIAMAILWPLAAILGGFIGAGFVIFHIIEFLAIKVFKIPEDEDVIVSPAPVNMNSEKEIPIKEKIENPIKEVANRIESRFEILDFNDE